MYILPSVVKLWAYFKDVDDLLMHFFKEDAHGFVNASNVPKPSII
jgi:hypothetical protein